MAGPYLQMALEQAPNYEGTTNKVSTDVFYIPLKSFKDDDGAKMLEEEDILDGSLASGPHRGVASYDPKPSLVEIHPRFSHMPLLLAATCGSIVTTAGVGGITVKDPDDVNVPVGAYRHVITFKATEPPQSAQLVARTGDGRYRKGTGIAISKLAAKLADDGAFVLDADAVGLTLLDVIDPSITPVMDDAYPLRRGDMSLTWLANSADTNAFDFEITSPVEAIHAFGVVSISPSRLQFANKSRPTIGGTIDKASLADADIAALLAGTQFAALIKMVGREAITTGYYPGLWIAMPGCQLTGVARDDIAKERRREGKWDWQARQDYVTDALATITVVNDTPSYTTYPA